MGSGLMLQNILKSWGLGMVTWFSCRTRYGEILVRVPIPMRGNVYYRLLMNTVTPICETCFIWGLLLIEKSIYISGSSRTSLIGTRQQITKGQEFKEHLK